MSVIYGAFGAVVLALLGTIGWYHWVTVPGLRTQIDQQQAAVAAAQRAAVVAQAQAATAVSDRDAMRASVAEQNQRIAALRGQCTQADAAASLRAEHAAHVTIPPPLHNTPAALTQWLDAVRGQHP